MFRSLLHSSLHPLELKALIQFKLSSSKLRKVSKLPLAELAIDNEITSRDFCYETLARVSRSFAVVIQQLPVELQDSVCVFYLVLRGLDSVEDDMTYENEYKIPLLKCFYKKLQLDEWTIADVGDSPDYRVLLANFTHVLKLYQTLDSEYQRVIAEVTQKMGAGMAEFIERDEKAKKAAKQLQNGNSIHESNGNSSSAAAASISSSSSSSSVASQSTISTVAEFDLYCHYVAGLVGIGLSQLFAASKLESKQFASSRVDSLSNSMGLFLQKTNIIRDYHEDLVESRNWWPREIWSRFSLTNLSAFASAPESTQSLAALNAMINNSLSHIVDVLEYLSQLHSREIFEFCAIPQVMAMATLNICYNNSSVLKRNVKIRKGESCWLMLNSGQMTKVCQTFERCINSIQQRIPSEKSEVNNETRRLCREILQLTAKTSAKRHSNLLDSFQISNSSHSKLISPTSSASKVSAAAESQRLNLIALTSLLNLIAIFVFVLSSLYLLTHQTAGPSPMHSAYQLAEQHFIRPIHELYVRNAPELPKSILKQRKLLIEQSQQLFQSVTHTFAPTIQQQFMQMNSNDVTATIASCVSLAFLTFQAIRGQLF